LGPVLDAFKPAGQTEWSTSPDQLAKNRANTTGCFPTLAAFQASLGTQRPATNPTQSPTQNPSQRPSSPATAFKESSRWYRLTSLITIGGAEFNLYSLLYQDNTGAVRPIQRSFAPDELARPLPPDELARPLAPASAQ
jgi:hypothetical protein